MTLTLTAFDRLDFRARAHVTQELIVRAEKLKLAMYEKELIDAGDLRVVGVDADGDINDQQSALVNFVLTWFAFQQPGEEPKLPF